MPRKRQNPNWTTAPVLFTLKEQADALYQDAFGGEQTPHTEMVALVGLAMDAFHALGVSRQEVEHALNEVYGAVTPIPARVDQPQKEAVTATSDKKGGLFNR